MFTIILAASAVTAVLVYQHLRATRPDVAASSIRRAEQLAAVVLVLSRAVSGVVGALSYGLRPEPVMASRSPRPLMDAWSDDLDDMDQEGYR